MYGKYYAISFQYTVVSSLLNIMLKRVFAGLKHFGVVGLFVLFFVFFYLFMFAYSCFYLFSCLFVVALLFVLGLFLGGVFFFFFFGGGVVGAVCARTCVYVRTH